MTKPQGAQHFASGQWLKIGAHRLIYRWDGDQWVRSTLRPDEINRHIVTNKLELRGRRTIPLVEGKKECRGKSGCGEYKYPHEFTIDKRGYYFSHCRSCENKRQQQYRVAA